MSIDPEKYRRLLVEMLPVGSGSDGRDRCPGDSVLLCENVRLRPMSQRMADISNVALGQSRAPAVGPPRLPPLRISVGRILGRRPDEEVIRTDASGIVAMVADEQAGRDGAVIAFPCESMGEQGHVLTAFERHPDLAVPALRQRPPIGPAAVNGASVGPALKLLKRSHPAAAVTVDVVDRLAAHPSATGVGAASRPSSLPATAFAQSVGDAIILMHWGHLPVPFPGPLARSRGFLCRENYTPYQIG